MRLEYAWVGAAGDDAPLIVFLHEGLGSLALWGRFPALLCEAAGARGLVYSRRGYGRSTPRGDGERWAPDYMHVEAREALPAFLRAVGAADRKPWLLGHSDGGSIALIHAASFPDRVAGAVVVAPHIGVEDKALQAIAQARAEYLEGGLRRRLARYHTDPDSPFWGWADAWLSPEFRDWNLEPLLPGIRCPLLAVQGADDEYGTLAQIEGIRRLVPGAELLVLDSCGHSPHRERPEALAAAAAAFIRGAR